MKKFSIVVKDTLNSGSSYPYLYLIEDDDKEHFIAKVLSYHETGRSEQEVSRLLARLRNGQDTNLEHGITRYTYCFVTFNGSSVANPTET